MSSTNYAPAQGFDIVINGVSQLFVELERVAIASAVFMLGWCRRAPTG